MIDADVLVRRGQFVLNAALTGPRGSTTVILGPNGAGKTTLLRALAGLEPLAGGRVVLNGRVIDDVATGIRVPTSRREVGFVFQDYRLFPHLTAVDNIAFPLRCRGLSAARARRSAEIALEAMGIRSVAATRPRALSGGQAQRVALARALAADPLLLLLDEPLSALDAEARADVRTMLRDELRAFAGASLIVAHDALEALSLGDQLVVLEAGRVTQIGTPADLVRRPATPYVAKVVGLNFWRGRIDGRGQLAIDGGGALACAAGGLLGPAIAILRPSAITLNAVQPSMTSARNVLHGNVISVEHAGERVRVSLSSTPPVVAEVSALSFVELGIAPGMPMWASVKATDIETYSAR